MAATEKTVWNMSVLRGGVGSTGQPWTRCPVEWSWRAEFAEACANAGVSWHELPSVEGEAIKSAIAARFSESGRFGSLWGDGVVPTGAYCRNPAEALRSLPFEGPVYVLFPPGSERGVLQFSSASQFAAALDQNGKFEFALTGPSFDYFLKYEHSEFFHGWGAVEAWVDALERRG
jgi:hypothetical protein